MIKPVVHGQRTQRLSETNLSAHVLATSSESLDDGHHVYGMVPAMHHKKGEYSTIRYFQREAERDHIHLTFITAYCYNYSFLLLIVLNLLLCLINKLSFITGMYI